MFENLEEALRTLIVLASMAVWFWIVEKGAPLLNLLQKYVPEWAVIFLYVVILLGGWLLIIQRTKK